VLRVRGPDEFRRETPATRAAIAVWAVLGVVALGWVTLQVLGRVKVAVVPILLTLFPLALLEPLADRLARRMPRWAVALVLVIGGLVVLAGLGVLFTWLLADEAPAVLDSLEQAYRDVAGWAEDRFGVDAPNVDEALERARDWAGRPDVRSVGRSVLATTTELIGGFLLAVVALFFFLKDGPRLVDAILRLVPPRRRGDAAELGRRVWATIGGYFRGQIVVAAVDAVFIGLGLVLLGVPAALPLAIVIFFGGLFPIVGAFTAGALAVLVALAEGGLPLALAVLALNVAVQQLEGNLLEPVIVGRATDVHPVLILVALTAGGLVLGVLGAFLAVPLTAAGARVVGFLLERREAAAPAASTVSGG
jgi:predicted PurR-regulated permease PerM